MQQSASEDPASGQIKRDTTALRIGQIGLILGLFVFVSALLLRTPDGLSVEGHRVAAVALLMVIWWMTEAIPLPATSLLPILLYPTLGIMETRDATTAYGDPVVFLLVGGFLIAIAMERWGLHKRIALNIVAVVGTEPRKLILGFMLGTAFISAWITNTAATMIVLPVAVAILTVVDAGRKTQLGTALVLAIAYAANIGGITTLIGTTPNMIFAAAASEFTGRTIGFLEWMYVSIPLATAMLLLTWLLLVRILYTIQSDRKTALSVKSAINEQRSSLGAMSIGERLTSAVLGLTVFAWFFRAPKQFGEFTIPGLETFFPSVTDATIALTGGLLLFALPVSFRRMEFVLNWTSAVRMPWGILWLLGGGLCLAKGFQDSGLSVWIGHQVTSLSAIPEFLFLACVVGSFVFLTEFTSNTATATVGMPIIAGVAVGVGADPLFFMAAITYAVSMAFMLPVATPPNAIVFSSGMVTIRQMARAGLWLNIFSVVFTVLTIHFLFPLVFG